MKVEIEHISKRYGQHVVLDDISVQIEPGEVIALLGPNGAGKTTLMREILRRCTWTHGYLPENNPLYPDMYVREYLDYMRRLEGENGKGIETEELIRRVGLENEANKHIRELSKGYKQRVGIAQAMLANPELLILDEPTTGLDPIQLVGIRSLIRELGQQRTVILSTHILPEVMEMCTRVWIIWKGKIAVDRPIGEVKNLEQLLIQTCQ